MAEVLAKTFVGDSIGNTSAEHAAQEATRKHNEWIQKNMHGIKVEERKVNATTHEAVHNYIITVFYRIVSDQNYSE